jgi:hypothetical protein
LDIFQPHPHKAVRFLELWEADGWRVKVYGISRVGTTVDDELLAVAKSIAQRTLPRPAVGDERYGVACLTIHPSPLFTQVLVDWWERQNELRHHVFKAEPAAPRSFVDITASGEAFCVWELSVLGFEATAWRQAVLWNPTGPDLARYLASRLDTVV